MSTQNKQALYRVLAVKAINARLVYTLTILTRALLSQNIPAFDYV